MSKAASSIMQMYLKHIQKGAGFDALLKTVTIVSASHGKCIADFTVLKEHTNFFGYLHGGFSATLVDTISGVALLTHKSDAAGVSVNINLSYLKGAQLGEEVRVEAKTIKAGKNLAFLEVEIKNKQTGDVLVTGSHTKYIG